MNLCSLNPKSYFVSFINAVSYKLQHLWFTISEIHQQSYRVYSNYVFKKYSRGERKQGNAEEIHQNISGCGIWIIFSFLHLFLYFPNFLQWAYLILLWFRKYNSLFQKSNTKCPRVSEPNLKKKKKKKKSMPGFTQRSSQKFLQKLTWKASKQINKQTFQRQYMCVFIYVCDYIHTSTYINTYI